MVVKKQSSRTSDVRAPLTPSSEATGWDMESGWDDDAEAADPSPPVTAGARSVVVAPFEPVPAVISYVAESSIPPEVATAPSTAPNASRSSTSAPPSYAPESEASIKLRNFAAPARPNRSESGTLRPAELEVLSSAKVVKSAAWPKWAAAATVLLVAGAGFAKFKADRHAAQALEVAAVRAAQPPAPTPPLLPAPDSIVSAAPLPSAAPEVPEAVVATPPPAPSASEVTVNVAPKGSIIFDHGKRIGTDVVHVTVEPGQTKRLVALRDGYLPRKFSVQGSDPVVNISLKAAADAVSLPAAPASAP